MPAAPALRRLAPLLLIAVARGSEEGLLSEALLGADPCEVEEGAACALDLRQLRAGLHLAAEERGRRAPPAPPLEAPGRGVRSWAAAGLLEEVGRSEVGSADGLGLAQQGAEAVRPGHAADSAPESNDTVALAEGSCAQWEAAAMSHLGWGHGVASFPRRLSGCGYFGLGSIWSRLRAKFQLKRRPDEEAVLRLDSMAACIATEAGIGQSCANCFAAAGEYVQENCRLQCLLGSWIQPLCNRCKGAYEPRLKACTGFASLPQDNSTEEVHRFEWPLALLAARGRVGSAESSGLSVKVFFTLVTALLIMSIWSLVAYHTKGVQGMIDGGRGRPGSVVAAPPQQRSSAVSSEKAPLRVPPLCPRQVIAADVTDFIVPLDVVHQLRSGVFPAQIMGLDGAPLLHAWLPFVGAGGDIFSFDVIGRRPELGSAASSSPGRGFWLQLTVGPTLRRPLCSLGPLPLGDPAASGPMVMEIRGPGGRHYASFEPSGGAWRVIFEGRLVLTVSSEFPFPHLTAVTGGGAAVASAMRKRLDDGSGAEALIMQISRGTDMLLAFLCMLAAALCSPEFSSPGDLLAPRPPLPRFGD